MKERAGGREREKKKKKKKGREKERKKDMGAQALMEQRCVNDLL